jgi:acyl-CoA thioester hydrolase
MAEPAPPFSLRITVRSYELDTQGHLNGAVYIQYADYVRVEYARRAGVVMADMLASGFGPINLETTVRFHRELRDADPIDVSCAFEWTDGKIFRVQQGFRAVDGTLAAEVNSVSGVLDLKARRLVATPQEQWRRAAAKPELLGL